MRVALVGLLIILIMSILTGNMTYPGKDDRILLLSSFSIMAMVWLYKRERRTPNGAEKKTKKEK